jgi:formate hydrogenlyase subunit 3/multisubunit Na+/H+ antiporter MnhD subunit
MSAAPVVVPGPLFFSVLAVLTALVCYVVHRWNLVSGLIGAASCLVLAWVSLRQASGESVSLLGRVLVLDRSYVLLGREWALLPTDSAVLTLVFAACGLAFLLALPIAQGWSFHSFGMGVVAALVLSVTAEQYIYSILFLWLASILAVFVLSGGRPGATTGAVRFLAVSSMAAMLLLAQVAYLRPDAGSESQYTATLLLVLGFGMLLMMVPFHGQLIAIAAHSAPMVPAFVLSAFSPVVFHILLAFGRSHPLLFQDALLFDVCRWLGTAAVALGGAAAVGQRRWGYLVGYATLVDWGAGLIALGQGTERGIEWAVQMLVWRAFSLLLVGTGLTVVFKAIGQDDEMAKCGGVLRRRMLGVVALIGGLFSLAGFPLTPGAAGRWPLIGSLLASQPTIAWVVILAGGGVCVGALSGLRACLGPVLESADGDRLDTAVAMGAAGLALWLVGFFTLHPALWLDMAQGMLGALSFLSV